MTGAPVRPETFAPLRHPAFRNLFIGRFATFIGNAVAPIALAFAVLDLSGSAAVLGLVIACRMVPQVVLTLFGGVIADRFSRPGHGRVECPRRAHPGPGRRPRDQRARPDLACSRSFRRRTAQSALSRSPPLRGSRRRRSRTASCSRPTPCCAWPSTSPSSAGPPSAGCSWRRWGSGWALGVDALTFAVAAAVFGRIRLAPAPESEHAPSTPSSTSMLHDLRVGWREFASRTWLWSVVVAFAFINAAEIGSISVLGPLVADGTVGRAAWGLVLSAVAVGMVVGGLVALRVRPRRTLLVGMLGVACEVPFLLTLGIHPTLPALVATAVISGVGSETFGIYWDLSMQQHVPQEVLSRVYSYDSLGSWIFMPIGLVVAGPLAQAIGTEETLIWRPPSSRGPRSPRSPCPPYVTWSARTCPLPPETPAMQRGTQSHRWVTETRVSVVVDSLGPPPVGPRLSCVPDPTRELCGV